MESIEWLTNDINVDDESFESDDGLKMNWSGGGGWLDSIPPIRSHRWMAAYNSPLHNASLLLLLLPLLLLLLLVLPFLLSWPSLLLLFLPLFVSFSLFFLFTSSAPSFFTHISLYVISYQNITDFSSSGHLDPHIPSSPDPREVHAVTVKHLERGSLSTKPLIWANMGSTKTPRCRPKTPSSWPKTLPTPLAPPFSVIQHCFFTNTRPRLHECTLD